MFKNSYQYGKLVPLLNIQSKLLIQKNIHPPSFYRQGLVERVEFQRAGQEGLRQNVQGLHLAL